MKGSYTLLIRLSGQIDIEVGSLGEISFSPGFYMYNGSAFGPGGLKRVERHKEKSEEGESPHWHIDYILVKESSEVVEVFKEEGSDHECNLSSKMRESFSPVDGFGCSDCSCGSHLFYSTEKSEAVDFLNNFYSE